MTAWPAPGRGGAGGRRRLPLWARGLGGAVAPQLHALAQGWQAQQHSMLLAMDLHPHQVLRVFLGLFVYCSISSSCTGMQAPTKAAGAFQVALFIKRLYGSRKRSTPRLALWRTTSVRLSRRRPACMAPRRRPTPQQTRRLR